MAAGSRLVAGLAWPRGSGVPFVAGIVVESPTKAGANPPVKRGLWTRSGLSASGRGWLPSAPLVRLHPGIRLISVTSRRAITAWQASSISSGASESNAEPGLRSAIWLSNPGGGAAPSLSKVSLTPWGRHQVPTASRLRDQLVACHASAYRVEAGSSPRVFAAKLLPRTMKSLSSQR